jgi:hypothetical protein
MSQRVNHKRLRPLLSEHVVALPRQVSKHMPSPIKKILTEASGKLNLLAGGDPGPLEAFSTDFTELPYASGNDSLPDGRSRRAEQIRLWMGPWLKADRELLLRCWERVREKMSALGLSLPGIAVYHDQDSVYTSYQWLRALLLEDGMRVSYSENGAKGNP